MMPLLYLGGVLSVACTLLFIAACIAAGRDDERAGR